MPSTRKQEAKEKRSRETGLVSHLEKMDIISGRYSRGESKNRQNEDDIEINLESNSLQQITILVVEHSRSLLNTNSREKSEITTALMM